MIQRVLRLLQRRAPAAVSHTIEPPTAVDLVLFTGQTRAGMVREFAVWCAKRVWNLVEDRSYDYDPSAHARFVSAVDTAERFARGRVSEDELRVVYHASVDPRCARSGWGPGRLANVGAFRDAALMSARFACRSTCEADATRAARQASRWSARAVGYLAVSDTQAAKDLSAHLSEKGERGPAWRQGWARAYNETQRLADEAMCAAEVEHAAELRRWVAVKAQVEAVTGR